VEWGGKIKMALGSLLGGPNWKLGRKATRVKHFKKTHPAKLSHEHDSLSGGKREREEENE